MDALVRALAGARNWRRKRQAPQKPHADAADPATLSVGAVSSCSSTDDTKTTASATASTLTASPTSTRKRLTLVQRVLLITAGRRASFPSPNTAKDKMNALRFESDPEVPVRCIDPATLSQQHPHRVTFAPMDEPSSATASGFYSSDSPSSPEVPQPQQQHQPERKKRVRIQTGVGGAHHLPTPQATPISKRPFPQHLHVDPNLPHYDGLGHYVLVRKMGEGAFSHVFHALDERNSEVAIKVIDKAVLTGSQRASMQKEVAIHHRLHHRNIVALLSHFETPQHFFVVLELARGGEIFTKIVDLTYFSERLARHVVVQVARGVEYLHSTVGVVHRDIKPENLLFTPIPMRSQGLVPTGRTPGELKVDEGSFVPGLGGGGIGTVKIADFGLSKVIWRDGTKTPCGTVGYTAPEIVTSQSYTASVDVWALGCVLYTVLCGFPPFYDEDTQLLTHKVARGEWTFLSPWWDDISPAAKDLVSRMLEFSPDHRYTIQEFFAHPWVCAEPFVTPVEENDLSPESSSVGAGSPMNEDPSSPISKPVQHEHIAAISAGEPMDVVAEPKEWIPSERNGTAGEQGEVLTHDGQRFDWSSFVIPALKTPATDRPPASFFSGNNEECDSSPSAISHPVSAFATTHQATAPITPSQTHLKHYFDTSYRVFNALHDQQQPVPGGAMPMVPEQEELTEEEAIRKYYDEMGYMTAGVLTPAEFVGQVFGHHPSAPTVPLEPGQSSEASGAAAGSSKSSSNFALKLTDSSILNKRKSKRLANRNSSNTPTSSQGLAGVSRGPRAGSAKVGVGSDTGLHPGGFATLSLNDLAAKTSPSRTVFHSATTLPVATGSFAHDLPAGAASVHDASIMTARHPLDSLHPELETVNKGKAAHRPHTQGNGSSTESDDREPLSHIAIAPAVAASAAEERCAMSP